YTRLEREIRRFIDSSQVSVVTVTSRFSQEVDVEQESGILSFFKSSVKKQPLSYINVGTGIIIDDQGHVVTRSSVVLGSEYNSVTTADGRELEAEFIGYDPETGFSVLKLAGDGGFKPASLAAAVEIIPGSTTIMIGNSLGVFPSIFLGTVNGVMQDGMIQLSVNLNPGGNGSPIYDLKGNVIGLVAGRLNVQQNFTATSTGFHYNEPTLAYPIKWIKRVADDLIAYGHIRKGWLGVVGYYDGNRPKVREIKVDSPAEQAGLVKGDIIVKYSSHAITNISELVHLVETTRPGMRVAIEFLRGDQVLQKEIEIGEKSIASVILPALDRSAGIQRPSDEQETNQTDFRSLIERNRVLEIRINYLEKEIEKLKSLLKSK
ncbi:trypsin-like peptidase domain-containing protein, partial [bacterium]|nr:trypsin-like peptidase domain-containing protein [bacterium]